MLARFFIDRPIFAWVISIVIVLFGLVAAATLPVAQYPDITPPTVQVTCNYPGASAVVVQDTVAAPIEQQVVGVEHMLYMSSQSANDGSYTLTVTFELGTDLDMSQVLVQNRVAQAMPTLPDVVQATGVIVKKKSPNILLCVSLFSQRDPQTGKPLYDQLYLSNYATIQIRDELARITGVGDTNILGPQDYSMRIWLDPNRLSARGLTAADAVKSLQEQNVQVAAGQIGQPPVPSGQEFQLTMTTLGRLVDAEQFENIVIKMGEDGRITRIKDIGRVELGARNLNTQCRLDGNESVALAIFQLPGSNALETADNIQRRMRELAERFPPGLEYTIAYDTTPFIRESIGEVFKTLRDAVILVAVVVLLFLQDWKALALPLIDVGVSLIGTFAVMALMGFTLNNLTLFGLVLAIGIVVDDAIVVLENIERWIAAGLPVREATIKAMGEITGPIIGITLVLSSVFLPSAFMGGITGQFFRQFALTIAASMIISAINAMTMTPARAASIFKDPVPGQSHEHHREALPGWGIALLIGYLGYWLASATFGASLGLEDAHGHEAKAGSTLRTTLVSLGLALPGLVIGWSLRRRINHLLGRFLGAFNRAFDRFSVGYSRVVASFLRLSFIVLVVYAGLLGLTYFGFTKLPAGFIPNQDKGYLLVDVQLPDSASIERSVAVLEKIEKICLETPGIAHVLDVGGQSFILNAISSSYGGGFIILDPFHERHAPDRSADAIAAQLRRRLRDEIDEAIVSVYGAPPVDGLGNAGGFKLMIEDRGNLGLQTLAEEAEAFSRAATEQPGIIGAFSGFRPNTPQLFVDIDRTKCKSMGVELKQVFDALQVYMGGTYVNDFNLAGRTWQVNVQAEGAFRVDPAIVAQLKVLNNQGGMVPLGAVAEVRDSTGPLMITRYNTFPAAPINGASLPGVSSGVVLTNLSTLAERQLPRVMLGEWTELSLMQQLASRVETLSDLMQNPITAFVGAIVLVFLILAAQYESWSLPVSIILVVPMCVLCALIGIAIARMDLNIFVQIGFVVLVGLASKNAILVVEFAKERLAEGKGLLEATVEASLVRLRPIVMTSFAFILGVVPLVIAHGAGAEMRRTLGTAVFSGMLGVTLFGVFLTPVFFYVIMRLRGTPPTAPPSAPSAKS